MTEHERGICHRHYGFDDVKKVDLAEHLSRIEAMLESVIKIVSNDPNGDGIICKSCQVKNFKHKSWCKGGDW